MRLRTAVLASLLTALVAAVLPNVAGAAPKHNHGLTIHAAPQRIEAGDGVLIWGQLRGSNVAGQTIRLYHRVQPRSGYTLVGTTTTNTHGLYEFTRAEGVVDTNRSWFVRGPAGSHSRTIRESVQALVTLSSDTTDGFTLHKVSFTGHVSPIHPFERVLLQERKGSSDDWHTLRSTFTRPGSSYAIAYRFRFPGAYDVRAVFVGDRRNIRSVSDPVSLIIQQAQIPGFTINTSADPINFGDSTIVSGVVHMSSTDLTPDAGVPVTLMERTANSGGFVAVENTVTRGDGSYQFPTQAPPSNTLYQVRFTMHPGRHSALLFEGVHDVVAASPSSTSGSTGQTITFTGTVVPGRADVLVYLQRLGDDGDWHTLAAAFTNLAGGYQIPWTLGHAGTDTFRVRALPDRLNMGGVSPRMTITVTSPASSSLPSGS